MVLKGAALALFPYIPGAFPMDNAPDAWDRIYGPTVDVTGDDFADLADFYGLAFVRAERPAYEGERSTWHYANRDDSVRMVARPWWSAGTGETYSLTVTRRRDAVAA